MRPNLLREIMNVTTIDIKLKIAAVGLVALLFISGIAIGQADRGAEGRNEHDISALNYEVNVHDKLLDKYGEKIEAIDSRTIRLETAVDVIKGQISLLDWIFGTCLLMIAGAIGHTIYNKVILAREEK